MIWVFSSRGVLSVTWIKVQNFSLCLRLQNRLFWRRWEYAVCFISTANQLINVTISLLWIHVVCLSVACNTTSCVLLALYWYTCVVEVFSVGIHTATCWSLYSHCQTSGDMVKSTCGRCGHSARDGACWLDWQDVTESSHWHVLQHSAAWRHQSFPLPVC